MIRTVTTNLIATVIEVVDLGELFPISAFNGRIGLNIRIEQGSLAPGKKVWLSGADSEEEVQIVGIEMLSNPHDPNLVRVICAKPKLLTIPAGKLEGWNIVAD